MKQLFLCPHLLLFMFNQSVLRLICIFQFHLLFHLFWRAKQFESENFVDATTRQSEIKGILWSFPNALGVSVYCRTARRTTVASARCEKVGDKMADKNVDRSALFFFHTVILGTNTFVLKINFLLSFCSFSIDAVFVFRLRFRLSSSFSSFVFVVVFETLIIFIFL